MAIVKDMVKCRHAFKQVTTWDANGNPISGPQERVFTTEIFKLLPSVSFNHQTYPNGGWVEIASGETIERQKAAAESLQKAAAESEVSIHLELIEKIETAFENKPDSLDNIDAQELKLYAQVKSFNWAKGPKNQVFESLKAQYEAARG